MTKINKITVLNEDTQLLKLIAVIAMLIDHIGAVIFPNILLLRIIGRIAFPLFAYSTFIGYFKTKNLTKYLLRLLLIAAISQPVYMLAFDRMGLYLNVFFSLIFELVILYSIDNKKWWYLPLPVILMFMLNVEYSAHLLILIPIFYYARKNDFIFTLSMITFYFNFAFSNLVSGSFPVLMSLFGIFSLPLILIKTNSGIKVSKWFYYIFYPTHLLILFIIKCII